VRKGHPKGTNPRVFLNLRREHTSTRTSPYINNPLLIFLASFPFHRKEIFPWEHGNISNWGAPPLPPLWA